MSALKKKYHYNYLYLCLLVILVYAPQICSAQSTTSSENDKSERIHSILESLAENYDAAIDFTDIQIQLEHFYDNPINLNHTNREELQELYLLSNSQIQNLLNHKVEFGNFISIYELQAVEGFDIRTIEKLLPFVTLKEASQNDFSLKNALKNGTNELMLRSGETLEKSKGYTLTSEDKNHFLGSPNQIYTRYNYHFGSKLSMGFTAEKDAGEQFFKGSEKAGFDFYSAHIYYNGGQHLKAFALGDYSVQFGQGLTMWVGLSFSKTPDVLNIVHHARGILPYRSSNENQYLRGGAACYQFGKFNLTAFGSHKYIDGTAHNIDTLNNSQAFFSALSLAGLHRNSSELAIKHTIQEDIGGGQLQYKYQNFNLGVSSVYGKYNIPLLRTPNLYNQFEFSGREFLNTGVNYTWLLRNAYIFGEVAQSRNGAIASINGMLITLHPTLDLGIIYRNYSRNYQAPYANAFNEGGSSSNENGTFLAMVWHPIQNWKFSAYLDRFDFQWLNYRLYDPSGGYDYLLDAHYTPDKKTELIARFRSLTREQNATNSTENLYVIHLTNKQSFRLQLNYHATDYLLLRTRMEISQYTEQENPMQHGFLAFQDIALKPKNKPYGITLRYTMFDVSNYNSRIGAYETETPSAFSIPFLQDEGISYYALIQYKISKGLTSYLRIARITYFNKESISTGLDEIQGNKKTDIRLMIDWKF